MRKIMMYTLPVVVLLTIAGCTKNNETISTEDSLSEASEVNDSSSEAKKISVFKGELAKDATIRISDKTVTLTFEKVETIKDEQKISDSLNIDGVILNLDKEMVEKKENLGDLKEGTEVEFTLEEPTMMTASIPPKIAGNSIIDFKIVK